MNILKIAALADYFYSIAGLLQVPPAMEQEITNWALSVYCQSVLSNMDDDPEQQKRRDYKQIQVECNQYIAKYPNAPHKQTFLSKSVPYISDQELQRLHVHKYFNKLPPIEVEFVFSKTHANTLYSRERWSALWVPGDNLNELIGNIYIYKEIPPFPTLQIIHADFNDIKSDITHELQHFVQTFLKWAREISQAGFPSSSIQKKYMPKELKDLLENPQKLLQAKRKIMKKIRDNTGDKNEVERFYRILKQLNKMETEQKDLFKTKHQEQQRALPHGLRDIEFYTDLRDTITKFKQIATKFPLAAHKFLVSLFTAQEDISKELSYNYFRDKLDDFRLSDAWTTDYKMDLQLRGAFINYFPIIQECASFFNLLKQNQPLKYQKALKEFYKEVSGTL